MLTLLKILKNWLRNGSQSKLDFCPNANSNAGTNTFVTSQSTPVQDCFLKLNSKCTVTEKLRLFALSNTDWSSYSDKKGMTFEAIVVPQELIELDPILYFFWELKQKKPLLIFRLPAWTFYKLHKDDRRGAAINLPLDDYDSITFFDVGDYRKNQQKIVELKFEPNQYVLINTQIRHGVINKGKDRYLLSIGLSHPEQDRYPIDATFVYYQDLLRKKFGNLK